ncbi:hypothetical protein QVD17_36278 [Tagetes erecta]|uniref:Uncharacterized protein n=1 Tax=Tagetes erecta TaxID=13708 RepID=A0AAD8JS49_TARER|nr:hypothetical protein QVD17_36278 [Tagetes erecta]
MPSPSSSPRHPTSLTHPPISPYIPASSFTFILRVNIALEPSVVQVWSRGLWARTTGAAAAAENDDDEQLFPASGETVTVMAAHVSEVGWRGEDDGDGISGGGGVVVVVMVMVCRDYLCKNS